MNENKKMYTGLFKVQRSNKSRSKVFSRTIRVGFKGNSLFQGEGGGGGVLPMIVSFFTCWFFKYMIGQGFHYTLKTD